MNNILESMVETMLMGSNVFADEPTKYKINGYTVITSLSENLDSKEWFHYNTREVIKSFPYKEIDISLVCDAFSKHDLIEGKCSYGCTAFTKTLEQVLNLRTVFAFIQSSFATFCIFVSGWLSYTPLYCVLKIKELPMI